MYNIVVTEAHSLFGLKIVKELVEIYTYTISKILALCPNPEKASELQNFTSKNSNVHIIKADLTDLDELQTVKKEIQQNINSAGVNLLINNAGIMIKDNIETMRRTSTLTYLEVNAMVPLISLTKALVPLLKPANNQEFKRRIVVQKPIVLNIAPYLEYGEEDKNGDYFPYRLSKSSVKLVSKSLSMELESKGIFVMAYDPGWLNIHLDPQPGEAVPLNSVKHCVDRMLFHLLQCEDDSKNGCLINTLGNKIEW